MDMKLSPGESVKLVGLYQNTASAISRIQQQSCTASESPNLASLKFGGLRRHLNSIEQITLDLEEICQLFSEAVQFTLPLDGLTSDGVDDEQLVFCGRLSTHKCK